MTPLSVSTSNIKTYHELSIIPESWCKISCIYKFSPKTGFSTKHKLFLGFTPCVKRKVLACFVLFNYRFSFSYKGKSLLQVSKMFRIEWCKTNQCGFMFHSQTLNVVKQFLNITETIPSGVSYNTTSYRYCINEDNYPSDHTW